MYLIFFCVNIAEGAMDFAGKILTFSLHNTPKQRRALFLFLVWYIYFCRYFAKGDCREGNDCKFSHNPEDIPVRKAISHNQSKDAYRLLNELVCVCMLGEGR